MKLRTCPIRVRDRASGFTIVETTVFVAILIMGLLALTATSLTTHSLRRASDERNIARHALKSMIEELNRSAFELIDINGTWPTNFTDTWEAGGLVGDTFPVRGLSPWPGNPTVGTIELVTDETMTDEELGIHLGLPVDLDNDGFIDNGDVSATAEMLPVVVRIRWRGVTGSLQMSQEFFVLSY